MKNHFILFLGLSLPVSTFGQDSTTHQVDTVQAVTGTKHSLSAKKIIFPAVMFTYGILRPEVQPIRKLDFTIRDDIVKDHPGFSAKIDEALQWTPTAALFITDAFGVKTMHTTKQHLALHVMSGVVMTATIFTLKGMSHRMRPDSSNRKAFPSGHTANAFRGADILYQELKHTNHILAFSGYAAAAATGVLRIYNNKHWFSDVVTGAGIGFLSSRVSYWIMEKRTRKKQLATGF
ncbi:MAG: phosphatase PAP2 family protein [Flavisolibacter sp.]|nr:phosphatase PAP2 family protein [Flavisolibacter sp.]